MQDGCDNQTFLELTARQLAIPCKKVLADKSETRESLEPAVIELAKLVESKVRAGK